MPLYEYQCPSCNKTHEVMQKFSDPPLDKCPDCGGPVTKIMSRSSFALKGAGWYTTDYKKSSKPAESAEAKTEAAPKADAPKTDGAKADGAKADGAKAEAKPAADSKPAGDAKSAGGAKPAGDAKAAAPGSKKSD